MVLSSRSTWGRRRIFPKEHANSHLKGSRHKRPIKGGPRDFEEVGHLLAALSVLDELAGMVGLLAG